MRNIPCPTNGIRSATSSGCGYDVSDPKDVETTLTSYDPRTGRFQGPDGRTYTLDLTRRNRPGTSPSASGLLEALRG